MYEHAFFLKELSDARNVRKQVIRNIEAATFPGLHPRERQRLLSTVIVGGGPTGVEFAAELHDLVTQDLLKQYPELAPDISITVVEGKVSVAARLESLVAIFRRHTSPLHFLRAPDCQSPP